MCFFRGSWSETVVSVWFLSRDVSVSKKKEGFALSSSYSPQDYMSGLCFIIFVGSLEMAICAMFLLVFFHMCCTLSLNVHSMSMVPRKRHNDSRLLVLLVQFIDSCCCVCMMPKREPFFQLKSTF